MKWNLITCLLLIFLAMTSAVSSAEVPTENDSRQQAGLILDSVPDYRPETPTDEIVTVDAIEENQEVADFVGDELVLVSTYDKDLQKQFVCVILDTLREYSHYGGSLVQAPGSEHPLLWFNCMHPQTGTKSGCFH
jgi:hypothetical protein